MTRETRRDPSPFSGNATEGVRPGVRDRLVGRALDWGVGLMERQPRSWIRGPKDQSDEAEWPPSVVPPATTRAVHDIRLRRLVRYVAEKSPFYRSAFARAKVDPKQIRGVSDIGRLPLTTSSDIQPAEPLLCVPRDEIAYIFETSGTSGDPKQIYLTKADFDSMVNLTVNSRRLRLSQHRPVMMIAHAQGMFCIFPQGEAIAQRLGGMVLPVGQPKPDETLQLMARLKPNEFMTSPSYMGALTRAAAKANFDYKLATITLDGEILTPQQVRRFAEFWGAEIYNGYGMTEVGGIGFGTTRCDALHLNDFQTFAEILDPVTLQPAAEGELIVTTLSSRAMPLLRYRTGDRCRWVECSCGWQTPAIHVAGRIDDSLVVAATNLHGPRIAESIDELDGLTGSLEVIVDHVEGVDRLTLRVGVEPRHCVVSETVAERLLAAYPALEDDLQASAFELNVELVENMRLAPKSLRVRDLRQ